MTGISAASDRVLDLLLGATRAPEQIGITSVCSAHPLVLEAACREGVREGRSVLIEATCNQVNQDGGYTGMTPASFRQFVQDIAQQTGLDPSRLVLGSAYMGMEQYPRAIAEYRRYLQIVPTSSYAHQWMAICYVRIGPMRRCDVPTRATLRLARPWRNDTPKEFTQL